MEQSSTAAVPTAGAAPAADRQPRILVVDDTPQNVRLLEAILIPRGYAVVTASSGQQALDRVAEQLPDIVLLDIMMPGHGRPRGLPAPARRPGDGAAAGRDGDGERRSEQGEGAGVRRGRLHPEAGQPDGAAGAGPLAAADQGVPRHDPAAGRRAGGVEPDAGAAGPGAAHAAGAGRPSEAVPAGPGRRADRRDRATSRCWRATAATSRWCSATFGASRRSPRRPSRKR